MVRVAVGRTSLDSGDGLKLQFLYDGIVPRNVRWGDYVFIFLQFNPGTLTFRVKALLQLRMYMDLRNSPSDGSQLMLNAIEPGSPLPIPRP